MIERSFTIRIFSCIFVLGFCIFSYLDRQNQVTDLRIRLPHLAKEIRELEEENTRLRYEIDQFENPEHLIELSRRSEFAHLKHPLLREVLTLQEGIAMKVPIKDEELIDKVTPKASLSSIFR